MQMTSTFKIKISIILPFFKSPLFIIIYALKLISMKDRDFTENDVYEKLLSDANLKYLYKNAVAQILATNGYELFYHTFINEKSRHNYEIDFLIARKNKICPIEVKSSGYRTHASLDAFCEKYSSRILQKYLIYTKDYGKDADIICLPIYMTPFI